MAITITRDLNMVPVGVPPVIHLSQYDDDFLLVFNLYSSVGTFTVESSTTAEIRGTKEDGYGYSANATIDISNKRVTVAGNNQMTACAGQNTFELVLKKNNKVLSTANFILDVEHAALDAGTIQDESVLKELNAIIAGAATATQAAQDADAAADRAEEAAQTLVIDPTLTHSGQAGDAKVTGDALTELRDDLSDIQEEIDDMSGGLTIDIKNALLALFQNVAYVGIDGQDYYDDLVEAFEASECVVSISAVFSPGSESFYDTDSLDVLRNYLTVTATLESGRTKTVMDYRLSGQMSIGTDTITVTYSGKTTTFTVAVVNGYRLAEPFVGIGTNSLEIHKGLTGNSTFTLAIEVTYGSWVSGGVNFIVGNRKNGQSNYYGLQYGYNDWDSPHYYYTWGFGMNEIKAPANKTFRFVCIIETNSDVKTATFTCQGRNVTDGTNIEQTVRTSTNASPFSNDLILGKQIEDSGTKGFNGTVSKFIFAEEEWTSDKITAFLNG